MIAIDDLHFIPKNATGVVITIPKSPPGISVIVPVKEPEPYLPYLVKKIKRCLSVIPHEIIIQNELGLTNAVIEGVKRSEFSHIAVLDADGSHVPYALHLMYKHFLLDDSLDLVIGSKFVKRGHDFSPFRRRFISHCFRYYAKFMLGLSVVDPLSGFVMGKRDIFFSLKPSMDYKFLLQLLCLKPSPKVKEVPIWFLPRRSGKSKASLKTGLRTLSLIHKLWLKRT